MEIEISNEITTDIDSVYKFLNITKNEEENIMNFLVYNKNKINESKYECPKYECYGTNSKNYIDCFCEANKNIKNIYDDDLGICKQSFKNTKNDIISNNSEKIEYLRKKTLHINPSTMSLSTLRKQINIRHAELLLFTKAIMDRNIEDDYKYLFLKISLCHQLYEDILVEFLKNYNINKEEKEDTKININKMKEIINTNMNTILSTTEIIKLNKFEEKNIKNIIFLSGYKINNKKEIKEKIQTQIENRKNLCALYLEFIDFIKIIGIKLYELDLKQESNDLIDKVNTVNDNILSYLGSKQNIEYNLKLNTISILEFQKNKNLPKKINKSKKNIYLQKKEVSNISKDNKENNEIENNDMKYNFLRKICNEISVFNINLSNIKELNKKKNIKMIIFDLEIKIEEYSKICKEANMLVSKYNDLLEIIKKEDSSNEHILDIKNYMDMDGKQIFDMIKKYITLFENRINNLKFQILNIRINANMQDQDSEIIRLTNDRNKLLYDIYKTMDIDSKKKLKEQYPTIFVDKEINEETQQIKYYNKYLKYKSKYIKLKNKHY